MVNPSSDAFLHEEYIPRLVPNDDSSALTLPAHYYLNTPGDWEVASRISGARHLISADNDVKMISQVLSKAPEFDGFWDDVSWVGPSAGANMGCNPSGGSLDTNNWTSSVKIDKSKPG